MGMKKTFDLPDVELDDLEFSRKFHVKSRHKKFIYDILHPRTIEIFLANEGAIWFEMEKDTMMICMKGIVEPDTLEIIWNGITELRDLLPAYLFRP